MQVKLTSVYLFGIFQSSFLKRPVTFAIYHLSGIVTFFNIFWNSVAKGLSLALANSLRALECSLSGPDDLVGFKLINMFCNSSSSI